MVLKLLSNKELELAWEESEQEENLTDNNSVISQAREWIKVANGLIVYYPLIIFNLR
ncbi:MAG: hypothetical protein Q8K98_06085 [Bacteroidota bacterium]|nr:hypothetical protein [Bacteroidota bacterium]